MRATAADYLHLLQQLLPPGAAWPRDADATLTKTLAAKAEELARTHNRAVDLIDEADPRTALEMLSDWETTCGLPDQCSAGVATTLQERRAAVVAKVISRGGQSRQFFIDLAAALGWTVTIEEFRPFQAGASAAGEPCCGENWRFVWRVNAPEATIRHFMAGGSAADEPIRKWGDQLLECVIKRHKPAQTTAQFGYGG